MKKLLLILMFFAVSTSVIAEWIEITKDDKKNQTIYVDPATISKNGNIVKIWILLDYKKAQELAYLPLYMSIKRQHEFNCKEEKIKKLYMSYHTKHMGGGEVIYSDNKPDDLRPVLPNSIEKELWRLACGKHPKP